HSGPVTVSSALSTPRPDNAEITCSTVATETESPRSIVVQSVVRVTRAKCTDTGPTIEPSSNLRWILKPESAGAGAIARVTGWAECTPNPLNSSTPPTVRWRADRFCMKDNSDPLDPKQS